MEGFRPEILEEIMVTKMPFGKYKGTLLINLPDFYLEWFQRKGMPPGKLRMQMATVYEIKLNGLMDLVRPLMKGK
ncbi:DUF3820 family protein [Frigoriflavimonas asaccharolytica]|nr:DUF3820 family protein [Frigoriflavimonas asaccharolytica]